MRATSITSLAVLFSLAFVACGATESTPLDGGSPDAPAPALEGGSGGDDASDSATPPVGDASADRAVEADASSKADTSPDAKPSADANASCKPNCQSHSECQATCPPAPNGGTNCCDTLTSVCYASTPGGSC